MAGKELQDLVGDTALRKAREICYFLKRDRPVLITGNTGTGKSQLAKEVAKKIGHYAELSCVDTNDDLFRSTLFGHKKGAFTGATRDELGILGIAKTEVTKTVILDEIGDLPKSTQAGLLRLIQERKYRRLGETNDQKTDVRFIAVTNKPEAIRKDLLARFTKVVIPRLAKRRDEIPLMCQTILTKLGVNCISAEAMICIMNHKWQANFRELENTFEEIRAQKIIEKLDASIWEAKSINEIDLPFLELSMFPYHIREDWEEWVDAGKPHTEDPSPLEEIKKLEVARSSFPQDCLNLYVGFSNYILPKKKSGEVRDHLKRRIGCLDIWYRINERKRLNKEKKKAGNLLTAISNANKAEIEMTFKIILSRYELEEIRNFYWKSISYLNLTTWSAAHKQSGVGDVKTVKKAFEDFGLKPIETKSK